MFAPVVAVGLVVRVVPELPVEVSVVAYYCESCNPTPGHKPCPFVLPDGVYAHPVHVAGVLFRPFLLEPDVPCLPPSVLELSLIHI